jgi:hypothetical protein
MMMSLTYSTMVVRVVRADRVDLSSEVESGRVEQKIGQLDQRHHEHTN